MSKDLRHALIIASRELSDLMHERAMLVVAALFTFGFPLYLATVASMLNITSEHLLLWALDSSTMPIFPAAMMMIHTFITDRDQGVLPTLLATPISSFSLFGGKCLPILCLGVGQGLGAYTTFFATIALRRPALLSQVDFSSLLMLPALVFCATLLVSGGGIIIASRIRSPRSAALALTFCSIFILAIEFGMASWLMLNQVGHRMAPDALLSQVALGIATLTIAANTYRRESIVSMV